MASLKLLVGGASAIGASALTSYLLMSDNTVSTLLILETNVRFSFVLFSAEGIIAYDEWLIPEMLKMMDQYRIDGKVLSEKRRFYCFCVLFHFFPTIY